MPSGLKQARDRRDRLPQRDQQQGLGSMAHAWIRVGAHQVAQRLLLLNQLRRHAALLPGTRTLPLPRSTIYAVQLSICALPAKLAFLNLSTDLSASICVYGSNTGSNTGSHAMERNGTEWN
jgi:hypothetical protein